MSNLEGWGFMSLIGCVLLVTLSMTILTGGWAIATSIVATLLGILAGGLYAASARQR